MNDRPVESAPSGKKISRRRALAAGASTVVAALAADTSTAFSAQPAKRPKIAALVTEYRKYSHGQNIIDRFLGGYGWESHWHRPEMDVVSLYVDQFPESDLSRERVARHPHLKMYPTIAEALTQGGSRLAVDGVLLIAEHGRYPKNEKGQTLWPRYEFFQETVDVFRASGRSVPVFCDKHLSWKWEWALKMVETSRELGFPMFAGSSLPVCRRIPSLDMPCGAEVEEIVSVGVGGVDGYDIHSLEAMQCLVERRRGGETGVVWIEALRGDRFWHALGSGSWDAGGWDPTLFEACLCRSHSLTPADKPAGFFCLAWAPFVLAVLPGAFFDVAFLRGPDFFVVVFFAAIAGLPVKMGTSVASRRPRRAVRTGQLPHLRHDIQLILEKIRGP